MSDERQRPAPGSLDRSAAGVLASRAADQWYLPAPVAVRVGSNALFVAGDDVVLRVGQQRDVAPEALMRFLAAAGVRTPLPIDGYEPIDDPAAGLRVTAIERLHPFGPTDWVEAGRVVRRVHDLDPEVLATGGLLGHTAESPYWQFDRLLDECLAEPPVPIDASTAASLRRAALEVGELGAIDGLEVVCHGDVHPGNVVTTAQGTYLLDWDLCALGPAAWDHAPLMTWTSRWGGEPGIYERFADGYGVSMRGDELAERLATGRLLAATLLRLRAARHDAGAREEAVRRLAFWRGDPDAPQWRPA